MVIHLKSYNKYGSNKCEDITGRKFDSQKEMENHLNFEMEERSGKYLSVVRQVRLNIIVEGKFICFYKADHVVLPTKSMHIIYANGGHYTISDFETINPDEKWKLNCWDVYDTKGHKTKEYQLKKKLVEALYGIEIKEI